MEQIEALQGRLSAALDQISTGLEGLERPVPVPEDDGVDAELLAAIQEQLNAALEAVETANEARDHTSSLLKDSQAALDLAQSELKTLQDSAATSDDVVDIQAALEEEQAKNAELQAQIETLSEKVTDLEALAADPGPTEIEMPALSPQVMAEPLTELDSRLHALQAANEALLENNAALRHAAEAGIVDAEAINDALRSELDAMTAARAADQAEARAVYTALAGMIGPESAELEETKEGAEI